MSAQPECPYCGTRLFPHEVSNDECGTCGRKPSVAEKWTPPGEERPVRQDLPLTLPGRPAAEEFATVRQGVALMRWGVFGWLVVGVVAAFILFAALLRSGEPERDFYRNLMALAGVFAAMAGLVVILGLCFCCAVPRGCEPARLARWLLLSLITGGLLAVVVAADVILHSASPDRAESSWLDVMAAIAVFCLLAVSCFGCFCGYMLLATLARHFADRRLARALMAHLISTLCALVFGVMGGCVGVAATSEARAVEGLIVRSLVLLAWVSLGAGLLGWLLVLLTRLHRIIPVPGEPEARREFPRLRRWD
jgi:hypothetical protein